MTILLIAIAVLLLAISVWQISKIFEVSNLGVKRDESQIASEKDNDMQGKLMFLLVFYESKWRRDSPHNLCSIQFFRSIIHI